MSEAQSPKQMLAARSKVVETLADFTDGVTVVDALDGRGRAGN